MRSYIKKCAVVFEKCAILSKKYTVIFKKCTVIFKKCVVIFKKSTVIFKKGAGNLLDHRNFPCHIVNICTRFLLRVTVPVMIQFFSEINVSIETKKVK